MWVGILVSAQADAAQTSVAKYLDNRKAAMALNFDTELYIAAIHNRSYGHDPVMAAARGARCFTGWSNIIADCEANGIPVSFNICGHEAVFGDAGRSEVNEIDIYYPIASRLDWSDIRGIRMCRKTAAIIKRSEI